MKVQGLDGSKVVQIAAGAEHSALVTGKYVVSFNIICSILFLFFVMSFINLTCYFRSRYHCDYREQSDKDMGLG